MHLPRQAGPIGQDGACAAERVQWNQRVAFVIQCESTRGPPLRSDWRPTVRRMYNERAGSQRRRRNETIMTANVESMFYHKSATPWHRMGHPIGDATTIEDACSKVPELAMQVAAYHSAVSEGPHAGVALDTRAVMRDDGVKVGEVGKGFEVVQSAEAFAMFRPWMDSGAVQLETGGTLAGGEIMFLLGRLQDGAIDVGKGDSVHGYVLFANAHNGKMSAHAGLTATRVVCCNTLAMATAAWKSGGPGDADPEQTQHRFRHTRNVHAKLADAGESITRAVRVLREAGERWRHMTTIQVRPTDAMLRAYMIGVFGKPEIDAQRKAKAEAKRGEIGESPRMSTVRMLLEHGQGAELVTARGTAWGLYNAVTEYLTHLQGRGDGVDADKRRINRNAFGDGVREMQRAETLALASSRLASIADLATIDPNMLPLVKLATATAA